jgi:hypothetical protein
LHWTRKHWTLVVDILSTTARLELEKETKKSVLSNKNYLNVKANNVIERTVKNKYKKTIY